MTKSLSAFAFGLLSLFAQSVQASGNETGNDLYANCTSQDPAFRFRCLGFIEGLRQGFSFGENVGIYSGVIGYQTHQPITASSKPIDAAAALELTHQLLIEDEQSKSDRAGCIPNGATNEQLMDVVALYLRDNPKTRNEQAGVLTYRAVTDAFPCDKSLPKKTRSN